MQENSNQTTLLQQLKQLLASPNLCSKKWIAEQYDSQVQNNTIAKGGDAAIIRVDNTNKALAITTDCNPHYVLANPFEGAKQAVAETYRNISATGAKPLAITNCLNFGNPQKPAIMGQIVRAIQGITEACKFLDYPVVSGNVSLYNETDGQAIAPTPAIGGVGLLTDLSLHCQHQFKKENQIIYLVGKSTGHLSCSVFEREILGFDLHLAIANNNKEKPQPPIVDLEQEKNNSKFIRLAISNKLVSSCHDISCGGLLVTAFEMCNNDNEKQIIGCKLNLQQITNNINNQEKFDHQAIAFGEEQSRYLVAINPENQQQFIKIAQEMAIVITEIGNTIANDLIVEYQNQQQNIIEKTTVSELAIANQSFLPNNFG